MLTLPGGTGAYISGVYSLGPILSAEPSVMRTAGGAATIPPG